MTITEIMPILLAMTALIVVYFIVLCWKLDRIDDKVGEETDDQLDEKIQQLEKDVDRLEKAVSRLEKSRTIEVKPAYPNITSTGITAYAEPEFRGVCSSLPTNMWSDNNERKT